MKVLNLMKGKIIVVHTDEGKRLLKIQNVMAAPCLEVVDSSGETFAITADNDYDEASEQERVAFENGEGQPPWLDSGKRFDFN